MTISEATVKSQIQAAIKFYDQSRQFGAVNGTNLVALQASFLATATTGDYVAGTISQLVQSRSRLAALLGDSGNALTPLLRQYGQVLNVPEQAAGDLLTRIYNDQVLNNKRVLSRGITFGSVTNGSPLQGNGAVNRLTVGPSSEALENVTTEPKVLECIQDASSGAARHEEVFQVRGASAGPDLIAIPGSGNSTTITAFSAGASRALLPNASFSQVGGTPTVPTSIPSWTSSVTVNATNFQFLTDATVPPALGSNIYRDYPGDSTPYSLQVTVPAGGSWTLSQSLEANRNAFQSNVPYFLQVAYKKSSVGTDGALTVTLGNTSFAVADLTTISDTNWHVLSIPMTSGVWFNNFDKPNLTLSVARSGGSTGTLTIDDIVFSPMAFFDGCWYAIVGGTLQFQKLDQFTITDTELGEGFGIIQKWLWRSFGRYLMACAAQPAVGTLTGVTSGTAGVVTAGTHVLAVTFVDSNGVESPVSAISSPWTQGGSKNVDVSNIPTSAAANTVSRWLYMSKAGTTTPLYRALFVNDNVSTSKTGASGIALADVSLTVTAPAYTVSFADPA